MFPIISCTFYHESGHYNDDVSVGLLPARNLRNVHFRFNLNRASFEKKVFKKIFSILSQKSIFIY